MQRSDLQILQKRYHLLISLIFLILFRHYYEYYTSCLVICILWNGSKRVQMGPNDSKWVQTGPNNVKIKWKCIKNVNLRQNKRKTKINTKVRIKVVVCHKMKVKIYISKIVLVHFGNMEGFRAMMGDHWKICEVQGQSHLNYIMIGFYRPANRPYLRGTVPQFSMKFKNSNSGYFW